VLSAFGAFLSGAAALMAGPTPGEGHPKRSFAPQKRLREASSEPIPSPGDPWTDQGHALRAGRGACPAHAPAREEPEQPLKPERPGNFPKESWRKAPKQ